MSEIFDDCKALLELFRKSKAFAVADERERILAATTIAFDDGKLRSRAGLFTTFRNIICASEPPESEPIAAPMTVETVKKNLHHVCVCNHTPDLDKWLTALVQATKQAQARRDAEIVRGLKGTTPDIRLSVCGYIADQLEKAAGLE